MLRERTAVLPQLAALLEEAAGSEAAGDLAAATAQLELAVALDPRHRRAANEQARVAQALRDRRFNIAMSEGYSALDEGRFGSARKAFREAAGLRNGSTEAASAMQEVDDAETALNLAQLQRRGSTHEQLEEWSNAIAVYEQALGTDSTLLYANEGLARARPRAELDARLQVVIEEPERLADIGVARDTETMAARARSVAQPGPRLREQIDAIETLLRQANTPVDITLRSDRETSVIVYKVARLGRFEQQQLTLRPGTYTAVGSRDGYRDVRRQFTVEFGRQPEPVIIICTERI
jgi:tetratricopeptide (TPR) repeat protein